MLFRSTVANTVSGLLRGTAGTGVGNVMVAGPLEGTPYVHAVDSIVYSMGRGNLLPEDQDYIVRWETLGDDTTTIFTSDIDLSQFDSTDVSEAIEVYIGGTRQLAGYTITDDNPVTVQFNTAPVSGVQVLILVRQGTTWYQSTGTEPSDGVALQDTETDAARFLRGEN